MGQQFTVISMLAAAASTLFGFWIFFPAYAVVNALGGRGSLRRQLRKVPLNLLIFWLLFAAARVLVFIHPSPALFAFIPEPLSTNLFFLAGAVTIVWWALTRRGQRTAGRPGATQAPVAAQTSTQPAATGDPLCPSCGVPMVLRTTKQGRYAGEQFYGCANFPRCREVLPVH